MFSAIVEVLNLSLVLIPSDSTSAKLAVVGVLSSGAAYIQISTHKRIVDVAVVCIGGSHAAVKTTKGNGLTNEEIEKARNSTGGGSGLSGSG